MANPSVFYICAAINLSNIDCILNCDEKSISVILPDPEAYFHLPTLVIMKEI